MSAESLARILNSVGLQEVAMAKVEKCAHPQCNCRVDEGGRYGKYCSEHCREAGDQTELMCDCKHPACQGTVG